MKELARGIHTCPSQIHSNIDEQVAGPALKVPKEVEKKPPEQDQSDLDAISRMNWKRQLANKHKNSNQIRWHLAQGKYCYLIVFCLFDLILQFQHLIHLNPNIQIQLQKHYLRNPIISTIFQIVFPFKAKLILIPFLIAEIEGKHQAPIRMHHWVLQMTRTWKRAPTWTRMSSLQNRRNLGQISFQIHWKHIKKCSCSIGTSKI